MEKNQQSMEDASTSSQSKKEELLPENLQDALVDVFRPILHELDVVVEETRNSQQDVKRQIDLLSQEVFQISTICEVSPTLEMYSKKMATIKRRVTVMHNILQNVQDRLKKLELTAIAKVAAPPAVAAAPPIEPAPAT